MCGSSRTLSFSSGCMKRELCIGLHFDKRLGTTICFESRSMTYDATALQSRITCALFLVFSDDLDSQTSFLIHFDPRTARLDSEILLVIRVGHL